VILTGKLKAAGLAMALGLMSLALASCGSGGGDSDATTVAGPPPVASETAAHLAKLSDRVATDLDAGDTCHAAHAADDLRSAVDDADLPASMRPSVDSAAGRLVDYVNCPPPPPPPEPKKKKDKPKEQGDEHHGDEQHGDEGHAKHGGFVPPGHAKLKG
jgi:hypothetical protein